MAFFEPLNHRGATDPGAAGNATLGHAFRLHLLHQLPLAVARGNTRVQGTVAAAVLAVLVLLSAAVRPCFTRFGLPQCGQRIAIMLVSTPQLVVSVVTVPLPIAVMTRTTALCRPSGFRWVVLSQRQLGLPQGVISPRLTGSFR